MDSRLSQAAHRFVWTSLVVVMVGAMMASELTGAMWGRSLGNGDRIHVIFSRSTIAYDRRPWPVLGTGLTWQFGVISDPQSAWPRAWIPRILQTKATTIVRIPWWLLAALPCGLTVWTWWGSWRRDPGRCPVCRYDLTGLASSVCPECGGPGKANTESAT